MAEEVKKRSKVSKLFRKKKAESGGQKDDQKKKKKIFDKNGHISRFFNRFKGIKKRKVDDEKTLVTEEEIEVFITPDPAEEKAAKKAKKKEKRKKRMKKIRKIALRSCHYIGMGVANMAPSVIYQSPNLENIYSYNYDDHGYYSSRHGPNSIHWTTGIAFANW